MSKRSSLFSRMGRGVKSYSYKILGMRLLKPSTLYIGAMASDLISSLKRRPKEQKDFAAIVVEQKLTPSDLDKKKKLLLFNSVLFLIGGLLLFFYACLSAASAGLLVFINYVLAAAVLFMFSFRMHFYRFLMKCERLDLTYRDWWQAILSGEI